ncbi:hypothetical protein EBO15_07845 [Actinomadura harenae]|uniref:Uncharacterized protein n=1 Tax=Actinomadura harenae TaxID=2483351 RepID=A0A3M2MBX5_9ACTN|nr:hypothetical protein EBO15_07845 [Actinomadura harenae]
MLTLSAITRTRRPRAANSDADSLLSPEVIAREIVEDLTAALAEFTAIAEALEGPGAQPPST